MAQVRVRVETAIMGFPIRSEQLLVRGHRVDRAIAAGRLVVLEEFLTAEELLAEQLVDAPDIEDVLDLDEDVEVVDEAADEAPPAPPVKSAKSARVPRPRQG